MSAKPRLANRIGWSIVALVAIAGLIVAIARSKGTADHRLMHWLRPAEGPRSDAASAYQKRDWARAAELARRSLKAVGNDRELLRIYARASARLERYGVARAIYGERLGPLDLETEDSFLLGLGLVSEGKVAQALDLWDKAARSGPDHPELLDHLARLSLRAQRLDEAASAAERLSRLPTWQARGLLLLGHIEGLRENPRGASDAIRKGLTLDPGANGAVFPLAHYRRLLARSLLQLGLASEAIAPLEAIVGPATGPGTDLDPEASWLLSRAYLRDGRIALAVAARERARAYRELNPLVPEPSPYVGAARCAACHAQETRAHEGSRHARTFHHGRALLDLPRPDHPLADPDQPNVTHDFQLDHDRIRVTTRAGSEVFSTVVAYAFGVPDRYVTMVGRDDDKTYRALRLSSYHTAEGLAWGPTAGDVPDTDSADNIRGQPMQVRDGVVRCLYCHVTQSRAFRDPPDEAGMGPEAADRGIGCERCHGPGGNHLLAIKAKFPDPAIVNTGGAPASAIVKQCANCHIVGLADPILADPENPKYVRSPGLTLTLSRCYTESGGSMSCLTCHDPHKDDDQPASFFEARCVGCHSKATASQKSCRVNPTENCLACHMPKVPLAVLHTSLTDHYIRVRKGQ